MSTNYEYVPLYEWMPGARSDNWLAGESQMLKRRQQEEHKSFYRTTQDSPGTRIFS